MQFTEPTKNKKTSFLNYLQTRYEMARMMEVITGKVTQDICGSWSDWDPRLYLDSDTIETIFIKYRGKSIKITIEEVELGQEA